MNCIITLKINDYFPKLESIPYEKFICLFNFGDFKGKISLSKNDNNICTHEITKISSDIKYIIHIIESNSNSLIGMCELLIPLIKLKQINPPCTIIQEQKLKLIIDVKTKRKLFKTLINSSDIFLYLRAEIFIPTLKNIEDCNSSKIEVKRKKIKFKNKNVENSPPINKNKKNYKDNTNNKKINKNDCNMINNNKINNSKSKIINFDNENNMNNQNKMKLLNDIKDSFKKIDEINLSSKRIKQSQLSQKRSPKKRVTILELMEQKMQPLLLNMNKEIKFEKEKNIKINFDKKINIKLNKSGNKLKSPKINKEIKKEINTIEKKSSKKCITSKTSKEIKKVKKDNSKCLNNPNQEINIDINRNLYNNNNFNKDKYSFDKKRFTQSREHSCIEYDDINSNYGILSTDERTEQVLSEIDKIILEKSTQLRDILENQIKISNNHKKISGTLYMKEKKDINKTMEINDNNILINKTSLGSIYNNSINVTQENVKNNYLALVEIYHLLNQKLSKIIDENNFSSKKSYLLKEQFINENKKIDLIKHLKNDASFNSYYNTKIKNKSKIKEQLNYTKNLESKLYQSIFDFDISDYEIIRQKEIERVNKLNESRILKILLKLIKRIISNIGNVSQVFRKNKYKQDFLKHILIYHGINEKEEGAEDFTNIWGMGISHKYQYLENENFENKIIKEVDEDKEEESELNSTNKKKSVDFMTKHVLDELKKNTINRNNNINDNNKNDENNIINNNEVIKDEIKENKEIELMKDILIKKYKGNKKFEHINNNEFLFDNKIKIKANLSINNDIIIEFENSKYNLNSFLITFCKDEIISSTNDFNKKESGNFVYTKKIMSQNEHQKRRRKRRIIEDSEEDA